MAAYGGCCRVLIQLPIGGAHICHSVFWILLWEPGFLKADISIPDFQAPSPVRNVPLAPASPCSHEKISVTSMGIKDYSIYVTKDLQEKVNV